MCVKQTLFVLVILMMVLLFDTAKYQIIYSAITMGCVVGILLDKTE